MARKDTKFEQVKHGSFTADIRLDKESGVFSCEYGDECFRHNELPKVREWARDALRRLSSLEWKAVMKVQSGSTDMSVNNLRNCVDISMHIERNYIAWDGRRWVYCPWVVMPPGTCMVSGPNSSDMEQDRHPMRPEELMIQRIRFSREFDPGTKLGPVLKFPIKDTWMHDLVYWVPYSEEQWGTIISIFDKLRELRDGINKMMSTETGWVQLQVISKQRLLEAPKDTNA